MEVAVQDRDVSELANFDRTEPILHPDRDRGVDCVRPERLVERQALVFADRLTLPRLAVKGIREHVPLRVSRLRNEVDSLQREITARLLNRYALSVTAPLLLLLGAIMAMWLRGSLPLTIYVLAFVPAVLDLILTSAGEQLMRDGRTLGPIVMWSGNAIMVGIIVLAYLRLARH